MDRGEIRDYIIERIEAKCGILDMPWHTISTRDMTVIWINLYDNKVDMKMYTEALDTIVRETKV